MKVPQTHAFISYVRENSDVADRLAADLRAFGIRVWVDRDEIMPGQWWKDAIEEAIQNGAYFIACFSKELAQRQETYMHGELRLAIDRLRLMPKKRLWFIPVLVNETEMPAHRISDHEKLSDINAVMLYQDWPRGIARILRSMELESPENRRIFHLIDLLRHQPSDRPYALEQLGCMGPTARLALPDIVDALHDTDVRVRRGAAKALNEITRDGYPSSLAPVEQIAKSIYDLDHETSSCATSSLGNIGLASMPSLIEAMAHERVKLPRVVIADIFACWGVNALAAVPCLIDALVRPDLEGFRHAIVDALGDIGPGAAAAIPYLAALLNDFDPNVASKAAGALRKISEDKTDTQVPEKKKHLDK